jgi:hypothetical protein
MGKNQWEDILGILDEGGVSLNANELLMLHMKLIGKDHTHGRTVETSQFQEIFCLL